MTEKEQEKAAKAREAALSSALTQIQRAVRRGIDHEDGRRGLPGQGRGDPHRGALARPGAGRRRASARAHRRDLRPGGVGQDHADLPRARRGPEEGRHLRVHRRGARDGPDLREAHRRRRRRAAGLAARPRRAGAGDRRPADPLGNHRRGGDRLGRGAHAEGRARGRDGRPVGRPPGANDEPGDAQARRQPQPREHALRAHQPDPREGGRDVRSARRPSPAAAR